MTRVWGAHRVGVRLSPLGTFNDISDQDPEKTFGCVAKSLNEYGLAYLHLVNPAITELEKGAEPDPRAIRMLDLMRKKFRGTLIITGGFDRDTAEKWLKESRADLIGFGRKFWPIPICRTGSANTRTSTRMIPPLITAAARMATSITSRLRKSAARSRSRT